MPQPSQSNVDSSNTNPSINPRLFRHSKRHQWGVAALVWERDGKRGYQFSDGKLRVFKEGYYGLFESAVAPGDGSAKAVTRLARLARDSELGVASRLPTLRDQIALFRRDYPEGFRGEAWAKRQRGDKARKRLKRHRDPALADAARLLGAEVMRERLAQQAWKQLLADVDEVLGATDLLPRAQLNKLRKLEPSRSLAQALFRWLHVPAEDRDSRMRRFNQLGRELGAANSWQLITALAALVHPAEHICVRARVQSFQGKMLLSEFKVAARPSARDYERFCQVARSVRDELTEAGLPPRDMLDVHDFMWMTLRPAAREDLLAVPQWRDVA